MYWSKPLTMPNKQKKGNFENKSYSTFTQVFYQIIPVGFMPSDGSAE